MGDVIDICWVFSGWLRPRRQMGHGIDVLLRCAPGKAKRGRVVRGRRRSGRVAAGHLQGHRHAVQSFVGGVVPKGDKLDRRTVASIPERSVGIIVLRRDRGREGDLDVPSRIPRAGAQSEDDLLDSSLELEGCEPVGMGLRPFDLT